MRRLEYRLTVLFICMSLIIIATLFFLMRDSSNESATVSVVETEFQNEAQQSETSTYATDTTAGIASQTESTPSTQIFLEYTPIPDYMRGSWEYLDETITYALNRISHAEAQGSNVTVGRHNASDIWWLNQAVETAKENAQCGSSAHLAALELRAAINTFNDAIIDPNNFYRPFLNEMARGQDQPQKRHLRGAWIATVLNIDWPSAEARGTTPTHVDMQMAELHQRFDEIAAIGYNAVIFQISPTGDAFFRSEMSPWSAWLTGETHFTGTLLDSNGVEFDPLAYAIRLAHERNMEFHAWLNPYRISHTIQSYTSGNGIVLSSTGNRVTSLSEIRNEWAQIPDTAFYLFGDYVKVGEDRYVVDPAAPGVRDWIVRRVVEVLENYDIDAVHFDDYFYPSDFSISDTFARYNSPEFNLLSGIAHPDTLQGRADWRRENTEMMIRDVSAAIRETAPWVKFGISPGGVWKSSAGNNTGLDGGGYNAGTGSASTTSWSNYHSSFADTRNWVIENLIDYLTPQIYWDWALPAAPYGIIAEWWGRLFHDFGSSGHLRNTQGEYTNAHLYIGLGLYRMLGTPPAKWQNAPDFENEGTRTFLRQEAYALGNPNIHGTMTFSQNQMRPGRENGMWETMQTLSETMWRYPALVPQMPHLGGIAPASPVNAALTSNMLTWENAETSTDPFVAVRYFVIYQNQDENFNIEDPANILAIIPVVNGQTRYGFELPLDTDVTYSFAITAVNRLHDESRAVRFTV